MVAQHDVPTIQQALDALITGDRHAAAERFTSDLTLTGVGGCLAGRTSGLAEVLERFAHIWRLTNGTFGTECEAVYRGNGDLLVAVTRHWAVLGGEEVRAIQALVVTTEDRRVRAVDVLSGPGPKSGIWD